MEFEENRPLSDLSTFGIGGLARYYVEVRAVEDMQEVIRSCHERHLQVLVLGKGSNSLFDDRGFDGVVIRNKIDFLREKDLGVFSVGAGMSFALLGIKTARAGWAGLEFAAGIPATVGGAVVMNAGANGGEVCDTLQSVEYVTPQGGLEVITADALAFSVLSWRSQQTL